MRDKLSKARHDLKTAETQYLVSANRGDPPHVVGMWYNLMTKVWSKYENARNFLNLTPTLK